MPKVVTVGLETLRTLEPFTGVWLEDGRLFCLGRDGDRVRRLDADYLWRPEALQKDVALSVHELEALLPHILRRAADEWDTLLYVPLTLLSEHLAKRQVDTEWIPRDPSLWMLPFQLEKYGLEVREGRLVKRTGR